MSLKLPNPQVKYLPPKLKPIDPRDMADIVFLALVLRWRLEEPDTNISHKAMPTWQAHMDYVKGNPHFASFLIKTGNTSCGHCYVSKANEIGVYVAPLYRRDGIGLFALKEMLKIAEQRGKPILANINPANAPSYALFRKVGFQEKSRTRKQVVLEKSGGKRPISTPAQGSDKSPDPGEQDINM